MIDDDDDVVAMTTTDNCRWWSTSVRWSCSRRPWPASTCATAIIRVLVDRVSMVANATPTTMTISVAVHSASSTPTAKKVGRPAVRHIYYLRPRPIIGSLRSCIGLF